MAHRMKFIYRIGFTVVILSCMVLFLTLGKSGNQNYGKIVEPPSKSKAARILHQEFGSPDQAPENTVLDIDNKVKEVTSEQSVISNDPERIVLAVVVCGDRLNETLVMLKSASTLTRAPLHFIIMAEDSLQHQLRARLSSWPSVARQHVSFVLHPITFPLEDDTEEWRKLFKPCASQRLFLPTILKDVDSLLYVDTDVLFLRPLDHLWSFFKKMNTSHLAAMTPEHEDYATGWYNRFARHPYYKPLGVNSGVMLMNLTRMRQFEWQSYVIPIYKEYKYRITWGDQDIINIIFHFHPDKLFVYPCEWNFRSDHCMYMSVCKSAEEHGVGVLHGNRRVFHNDKQPAFKAIYRAFEQYELGEDLQTGLLQPMQQALRKTTKTNCGKLHRVFLKALKKYLPDR